MVATTMLLLVASPMAQAQSDPDAMAAAACGAMNMTAKLGMMRGYGTVKAYSGYSRNSGCGGVCGRPSSTNKAGDRTAGTFRWVSFERQPPAMTQRRPSALHLAPFLTAYAADRTTALRVLETTRNPGQPPSGRARSIWRRHSTLPLRLSGELQWARSSGAKAPTFRRSVPADQTARHAFDNPSIPVPLQSKAERQPTTSARLPHCSVRIHPDHHVSCNRGLASTSRAS